MGKFKATNYKNHYPLPPNSFKISIELTGEAIKITSEDKEIMIDTSFYSYGQQMTRLNFACDTLIDVLKLNKKHHAD